MDCSKGTCKMVGVKGMRRGRVEIRDRDKIRIQTSQNRLGTEPISLSPRLPSTLALACCGWMSRAIRRRAAS
jgi:hypothetical protein